MNDAWSGGYIYGCWVSAMLMYMVHMVQIKYKCACRLCCSLMEDRQRAHISTKSRRNCHCSLLWLTIINHQAQKTRHTPALRVYSICYLHIHIRTLCTVHCALCTCAVRCALCAVCCVLCAVCCVHHACNTRMAKFTVYMVTTVNFAIYTYMLSIPLPSAMVNCNKPPSSENTTHARCTCRCMLYSIYIYIYI
jgi:hypothetical protein